MKWGMPSLTRYFVILFIAFLVSVYMIHDFKDKYQSAFLFDVEESDF